MEFVAGLMTWLLLIGGACYVIGSIVQAVKTVIARKRAKGDDTSNNVQGGANGD